MSSVQTSSTNGMPLQRAALIAGFGYLLNPVSYAEFVLYPKLVVPDNIGQTIANINAHGVLFGTMITCYFLCFVISDIVVAWALYFLLAPVNRAVSLLTASFRVVYAAIGLVALYNLVCVQNLLHSPLYREMFGTAQWQAQVLFQLRSFHNQFDFALALFGIHLILLGCLIAASRYVPKWLGAVLVITGSGYTINTLGPYFQPSGNFNWTFFTFFGEILFMIWLLARGWKVQEPACTPIKHSHMEAPGRAM